MFSPKKFGQRLLQLRGELTREELSSLTGIPSHTLRRYEQGLNEKPAFQDVIRIGKVLGYTPNQMAAAADLWVLNGTESTAISDDGVRAVQRLQNYLVELDATQRERMIALIDLAILVDRRRSLEVERSSDPITEMLQAT